jgi:hypothetical protein
VDETIATRPQRIAIAICSDTASAKIKKLNVMKHHQHPAALTFAALILLSNITYSHEQTCATEPNVEIASRWWPEMPNVYSPVGWKNHLFRFTILYSGAIVAEPDPRVPFGKKHTAPFAGLGAQVTITPTASGTALEGDNAKVTSPVRSHSDPYQLTDLNANLFGYQGWAEHPTPVLWTAWRQPDVSLNGITLKEEVFGHIAGARDVQTGTEPLFGWVRISVAEKLDMIQRKQIGFNIRVNAPHVSFGMWALENVIIHPAESAYPRKLSVEMLGETNHPGCLLTEDNGKVRLAVLPGKAESIVFKDRKPEGKDYSLHVIMPANKGAHVDLLLPFIPTDRALVETEMTLGYDGSLEESDRYWSVKPTTAAEIETPEPLVNGVLRMTPKLAQIIAEKNPETGQYASLVGGIAYSSIWATPQILLNHMLLDPLGFHDVSERYLKIYKDAQGTSKAPGPNYAKHPGYLCAPRSLASYDWITDHGSILHAICLHGLLTGDRRFIDEYTGTIIKACEFIRDARHSTNHPGVMGVLPPASASDLEKPEQALWSDGWNYKGLTSAARLLRMIGHPRAKEFEDEAIDYKRAFQKALREKVKTMPSWRDAKGNSHPLVPTSFMNGDENFVFYLDTGPLFLVYAGLMDANDELMRDILLYFREGPNQRTFDPAGHYLQPPVLHHELSSCEMTYSWNIFHSWQSGDRMKFLEGMYSLITGGMSRQTFVSSEHRGGMSGLQCVGAVAVNMIRLSVVDDQIEPDSLHLLRLVPLAWVTREKPTKFVNMPTEFGPVSLQFQLSTDEKTLNVSFSKRFRTPPKTIVLHTPPILGLKKVVVNGTTYHTKDTIGLH